MDVSAPLPSSTTLEATSTVEVSTNPTSTSAQDDQPTTTTTTSSSPSPPSSSTPQPQPLPLDPTQIDTLFTSLSAIDLLSSSLGGSILSVTDDFFAPATNLINPAPPIRKEGVYVESGAWYDGWESRRHNTEECDWCVVRLGTQSGDIGGTGQGGRIVGVEIDTAFFVGNHAEEVSVLGAFERGEGADKEVVRGDYKGWKEVLGRQKCEGGTRHAWLVPDRKGGKGDGEGKGQGERDVYTHVKLCMYPDGGVARFRCYGRPAVPAISSTSEEKEIELSAALNGGVALEWSDQHFGHARNLLLPGRGKDMRDGWETKRSREKGHTDWVVVKLGGRGKVKRVVVDTWCFRGNFPRSVRILGRDGGDGGGEGEWWELGGIGRCERDKEHEILVGEGDGERVVSHVKMIIEPDGGVKRLRVFGTRV